MVSSAPQSASIGIREQLKLLEQVQELDLKIDQLRKSQNAMPAALKAMDDSISKLRVNLSAREAGLTAIDKELRQNNAARDLNNDRLTRSTARLEGVQNSQEFQAVTKEIEQLKKMNGTLEEQIKKLGADSEAQKVEIEKLKTELDAQLAKRGEEAAKIEGENSKLGGEIDALLTHRGQHTVQVNKQTLSIYDRVRGARAGLGLVPAVEGRCKGCNMMVPPQLYILVQKGLEVQQCPSCFRLLFIPGEIPSSANNQ